MEADPNNNKLLLKQSSVDDAWDKLSDHQKIFLMKSRTKDFDITKDELKVLLFTLPFTEQEINTAYAVNNGGAVLYTEKDIMLARDKVVTTARVDKFHSDGTATITTFTLDQTNWPHQVVKARIEKVAIEDYVVDTFGAVDTDILTKYTIFKSRCKKFGYSEDVARKRLIKDFNKLFKVKVEINSRIPKGKTLLLPQYMQEIYANGVAIYDQDLTYSLYLGNGLLIDYHPPYDITQMSIDWTNSNYGISSNLLQLTGVDLINGLIHDPFRGYDELPYADTNTLKYWIDVNFKRNHIPYLAGKKNNIRICMNWINFDQWGNFDKLIEQINLLITPCDYQLEVMTDEDEYPRVNMWVKLTKL